MIDVVTVPDRLEDGIGKAEDQDVLNRLFAQVVIDAVNLGLVKDLVHTRVQLARAGQVAPEGFLDDDARVTLSAWVIFTVHVIQTGRAELLHDDRV